MARDDTYFQEIEQINIQRGGYNFTLPIFHYDSMVFGIVVLADYPATKALLPSPRLEPFSLPLHRTLLVLTAFEHRECELGSFNELLVLAPIRNPAGSGLRAWFMPWLRPLPSFYIMHAVSNNPKATTIFREIFNFPIIDGNVNFEHSANTTCCVANCGDDLVISITVPRKEGTSNNVLHFDLFSIKSDRVLRSEVIGSIFGANLSMGRKVKIEVGSNHFISRDLGDLKLGRVLALWHIPHTRFIVTNPIESLSFKRF